MIQGSFRLRLTLWTAGILGVSLIGFTSALFFTQRERLRGDIDRDMRGMVGRFMRPPGRQGQGPGQGQGQGPGGPGGPGFGMGRGPGPDGPGGFGGPGPIGRQGNLARLSADPIRFYRDGQVVQANGFAEFPDGKVAAISPEGAKVAIGGREDVRVVQVDGMSVRVLSIPFKDQAGQAAAIQVARGLRDFEFWERSQATTVALFVPIACLVAGLGAWLLATRGLRPVQEMADAAGQISGRNLSGRLPIRGQDELAGLGSKFNEVLDRLEDAFDRQRQFTADASHELRTPLTRIRLAASEPGAEPEQLREALRVCGQSAESMTRLVEQLLVLSRADSGRGWLKIVPTDVPTVVIRALERLPIASADRIDCVLPEEAIALDCDIDAVARAISNLLDNALRYSPDSARVELAVCEVGEEVEISVRDLGPGISEKDLPHLFERFYRVDEARSGSTNAGLGLSIVQTIVSAHGGTASVESKFGQGSRFLLKLPKANKFLTSGP